MSGRAGLEEEIVTSLRSSGARFAFVFGSRAGEAARRGSDLDVAAWWGTGNVPDPWELRLPEAVDLVVLDDAPLWLTGRVALQGRLLFDDAPPERVAWQADTRLIYLDELPGLRRRQEEWLEQVTNGR